MIKRTGRCSDCAMKYGISIVKDLLETGFNDNVLEMLSLSVAIAIKLKTDDLDDSKRCKIASIFRSVAFLIENEPVSKGSLLDAFLGKTTRAQKKTGSDNV